MHHVRIRLTPKHFAAWAASALFAGAFAPVRQSFAVPPALEPVADVADLPADVSAEVSALVPDPYRQAVAASLRAAGARRGVWLAALRDVPPGRREGLAFLLATMPRRDLASLDADFVLENVALAYKARDGAPWGKQIPDEVFFDAVLPYANLNERREPWRRDFAARFAPAVSGCKTASQAALALNAAIFDQLNVHYHPTKRPKPDQSPSESVAAGFASCSGLSVLLADACRAAGVPARVVGTPAWAAPRGDAGGNHRGNHTWVEIWDGQWHVLGASEVTPLDRTWFLGNAALALPALGEGRQNPNSVNGLWDHRIYAACWHKTPTPFSMVWDPSINYVPAEDVTAAYADRVAVRVEVVTADPRPGDGVPASARVVLRQQGRLVADLTVDRAATLVLSAGQTYDALASSPGRPPGGPQAVRVPEGKDPVVRLMIPR